MRTTVLVIAGSDSSGGAGIQADIKALDHIGVQAATAVTSVTSQNSRGVRTVYPMTPGAVLDQASQVLDDMEIDVVKCGMLYSEEIIRAVSDLIGDRRLKAVVDPVMVATSGGRLLKDGGARAYAQHLIPKAWAATPNVHEAEALLGKPGDGPSFAQNAGKALVKSGARAAVVKGGHGRGGREVIDTMVVRAGSKTKTVRVSSKRLPGQFHGAGCHFASFMAGFAARGVSQERAFRLAHEMTQQALRLAQPLGKGPHFLTTPPTRFLVEETQKAPRDAIAWDLAEAVLELSQVLAPQQFPEVGINFGFALPRARGPEQVCAVDGRLVVSQGRGTISGPIRFGGSRHVARILVACAREAPSVRAACNLRLLPGLEARAKRARLRLAWFDRADEPKGGKVSTMSWGTASVLRASKRLPDLIADRGAPGKEPMVRVLGRTPAEVVQKVRRLTGRRH